MSIPPMINYMPITILALSDLRTRGEFDFYFSHGAVVAKIYTAMDNGVPNCVLGDTVGGREVDLPVYSVSGLMSMAPR